MHQMLSGFLQIWRWIRCFDIVGLVRIGGLVRFYRVWCRRIDSLFWIVIRLSVNFYPRLRSSKPTGEKGKVIYNFFLLLF